MFDGQVIGQRRAVSTVKRLLRRKRIPHGLLLFGPEGTGKAALAVELVRALHCDRTTAEGACGECRSCGKTASLNHPDLSLLFPFHARIKEEAEREILLGALKRPYDYSPPEETSVISVDRIRNLQKQFSYGSYEGKWRTVVILHADKMRPEAANALLKTLEEPPARSLLVLTAPSQESLLPTIVSRCQFLKFSPLSSQDVVETLISQDGIEADRARFIARACGGNLRRAREMVGEEDVQLRSYRFWDALIWGEESKTYAALEQLAGDRQRAIQILGGAALWLRDILVFQNGNMDLVSDKERLQDIKRLSEAFDTERLLRMAQKIENLREMNLRNVNMLVGLVSLWREAQHSAGSAPRERLLKA